jgi:pentose-5-phosphate-3-epimerase
MSLITPTITTDDPHIYREQIDLISSFAEGVHLDFADGILAPTKLLPIAEAYRADNIITHAHVMYQHPLDFVDDLVALEADLVVLHAEADDVKQALERLTEQGVRTGIAVLPDTTVADVVALRLDGLFEHILIFGGKLGYQGGQADLSQLSKVAEFKKLYSDVEFAWDGGVNDSNAQELAKGGIQVLNAGGYIKNADDPKKAYDKLSSLIQS